MPEISPRLPCPVCLGVIMDRVAVGPGGALQVDVCRRCGGAWLEHGEVQRLRAVPAAELWKRVEKRHRRFRFRMCCHDCHAPLERAEKECPGCGWSNTLDCPACGRAMRTGSHAGLRLDVCGGCRGVWFDHHELGTIWKAGFARTARKRPSRRGGSPGFVADAGGEVLLQSVFHAPELVYYGVRAAGHAASASAEAVSLVPDLAGVAPGAAAAVFEAVGEAAGSVFEVVVAIVCGIFDGL
jgi:Zn-finger nucleic acid-binding protein